MPIEIPLPCGRVALIDEQDAVAVRGYSWWANPKRSNIYVSTQAPRCGGRRPLIYLHRLIMAPPPGLVVDHIDGNGLNNLRNNLRLCSPSENCINRRIGKNAAGYKGVRPMSGAVGRFYAHITRDRTLYYLGAFATAEQAARAYDAAAIELHGAFARLNFPVSA